MTVIISLKNKKSGMTKNIVTSQTDLHKTFWGRKEDFPTSKTHEVFVNDFMLADSAQDRIATAFNTPDMDFGKTFERGYWELYVLTRQSSAIKKAILSESTK
jgi:hypothetical protein